MQWTADLRDGGQHLVICVPSLSLPTSTRVVHFTVPIVL